LSTLQSGDYKYDVEIFEIIAKGTYSITASNSAFSSDKIELILSDNTIEIYDISYTENTVNIDNCDFIRVGMKR
jgi:hypothetical protein